MLVFDRGWSGKASDYRTRTRSKDDDDGMLADLWIESVQAEAQQVQRPVGHFRSLAFIGIDVGTVEKFWQNMTRYNVL